MSERGTQLSQQLDAAAARLQMIIEKCPDEKWQTVTQEEGWPINVVAYHTAQAIRFHLNWTRQLVADETINPPTEERIHEGNARFVERYSDVSRERVLKALADNGGQATQFIAGLSDTNLNTKLDLEYFGMIFATVEEWISKLMIGHIAGHTESLEATV